MINQQHPNFSCYGIYTTKRMLKSNYKWQEIYNKITTACNKMKFKKPPNDIGL